MLYFVILALFCCCISSYKLGFEYDQNEKLIGVFETRIRDKNSNIMFKIMFYVLKHIQTIVLLSLFVNGRSDLNSLRNLGFMVFFVGYTASEKLYRSTCKCLVAFLGFFI